MERESSGRNTPKRPSRQTILGASKSLQMIEDDASRLVGSIIEKCISEEPNNKPLTFPRPTVLPFPLARHRSHGPHWTPMGSKMDGDDDGGDGDEEDEDSVDFDPIAAFANPIQRKQKKDLDFSKWRQLIPSDKSSVSRKKEEDKILLEESKEQNKDGEINGIEDKRNTSDLSLANEHAFTPIEMNVKPELSSCRNLSKTGEGMTDESNARVLGSVGDMETDNLDQLHFPENVKDDNFRNFKGELGSMYINSQIGAENCAHFKRMLPDEIEKEQAEITDKTDPGLLEMLKKQGRVNMEKQKNSTSYSVSSSRFNNFGNEQGSMALESQIDAENCARLQRMSPDEIAEAQAEIMEKMDPALLKVLKKRGQDRLKKQKPSSSDLATNGELGRLQDGNQLTQDAKGSSLIESDSSHMVTTTTSKDTRRGLDNDAVQNLGPASSSLWNAWSERVEAVRELRFSFDGNVIENHFVQIPATGNISVHIGYSADNVTERDFLRTEGDPGAVGYTIKEALALTRSVVPGQRALALHLLASVLDKALHNIRQNQVGCTMRNANNVGRFIDWEAVWAFALGPEPELVLSLRMSLDDNHNSVVLACAKVIQGLLSFDMNENFFDFSEKIATYEKNVCTAPVFRSRPEIDVGFLHGGFWKYNAKPSNILPFGENIVDDKTGGNHTIQDDIFVAGQDFAAGLVRMGILPRIRYLLEMDPTAALEESIISILIAIARHSPTCANAIIQCQRLVQTVVDRVTMKDKMEIHPSKIKSVTLLKVLAQSDKKNCIEFIKNGIFRDTTWHLYRYAFSLDHWVQSGRENCKLASALMVEQLRFWKVCIQYGYCVSYFADFFPALCLWLNPPKFEKLIENNVLSEFASITTEAYLVLEALARRLPNFYSKKHLSNQIPEFASDDTETWCWSHVGPMVDLALKWIALKSDSYISIFFGWQKGIKSDFVLQDLHVTPLLWVISSVLHMLSSVLERVTPEDTISPRGNGGLVPWLPEFVPKIGLEIIKNGFLSFSGANSKEYGMDPAGGGSFIEELCHLRHHSEHETSLASLCCLRGLVRVIVSVDNLIQLGKTQIHTSPSQGYNFSREGKILEDGILKWSLVELRSVLITFMKLVVSDCHYVQSIEMFGRGGPAPGVGLGWCASGGGFWSTAVLLAQTDAGVLVHLLEIFLIVSAKDLLAVEDMTFTMQMINSALGVCLILGPGDRAIMENALDILLQVPVLKCLDLFVRRFLHLRGIKTFGWELKEEDYLLFSKILASHFRNRWLCVKKKNKAVGSSSCSGLETVKKGSTSLDTIHEDLDTSDMTSQDHNLTSLVVEWAHQRLPLPIHWFLSPISTIPYRKNANLASGASILNLVEDPTDFLEVAKGGLFFLLGIEAIPTFLSTDVHSPVQRVSLTWKLHSLSVILLVGMGVLEEEKSRDMYEALQEHYGQLLDESRFSKSTKLILEKNENLLPPTGKKNRVEFLNFQSEIHESYSTFIETLVEQFAAISYGDLIYGRQVAIYLHRHVEAPIRLTAWNALSNARVLELLPPILECFAEAEGYLEPVEDNEGILEAYVKSWVSGAVDRAATRGSVTFTLVLHHLSSFIFHYYTSDKLSLRNKLAKSLLRDYSRKRQHECMMLDFIRYNKPSTSQNPGRNEGLSPQMSEIERRFEVLTEACEGNFSLLSEVEKLKSLFGKEQHVVT